MAKGREPRKDDESGEEKPLDEEAVLATTADDWMNDEDEDPMEDNSLEIDEEEV